PNGNLLVIHGVFEGGKRRSIVRINPVTGTRTVVSGCPAIDSNGFCFGTTKGNGPFDFPQGIAVRNNGTIIITDSFALEAFPDCATKLAATLGFKTPLTLAALVQVNPNTGDRTVEAGFDPVACTLVGGVAAADRPNDLTLAANGDAIILRNI